MEEIAVFKLKSKVISDPIEDIMLGTTVRPRHSSAWNTDSFSGKNQNQSKTSYKISVLEHHAEGPTNEEYFRRQLPPLRTFNPAPRLERSCHIINWGKTIEDYCEKSTLHGLKYIGDRKLHIIERGFWIAAFILAFATAAYYISVLYSKWKSNPVIVSVGAERTSLVNIPFPAVTICNMNHAKKSVVNDITNKVEKKILSSLCESDEIIPKDEQVDVEASKWTNVAQFMIKVSQSCSEMIKLCIYAGNVKNCDIIFNAALTDEGLCCTFNQVERKYLFRNPKDLDFLNITYPSYTTDWTPDDGYPQDTIVGSLPVRPRGAGEHLGLSVVLDVQSDEYYCSSTSSVGFKVLLHNPVETPKMKMFGFFVSANRESRIVIRPAITGAAKNFRSLTKQQRMCSFSDEEYLRFYRTYTQRNCALECEANYTLERCDCVSYYMPKGANTKICSKEQEECAEDARKTMELKLVDANANTSDTFSEASSTEKAQCKCLPGCNELGYTSYMTAAPLGKVNSDILKNLTQPINKDDMAILHLYFTENQFLNFQKGELFGFIDFLSSTGGLLGLFMGFSFLSVVEGVYFLTLRMWCVITRGRLESANGSVLMNQNMLRPFRN